MYHNTSRTIITFPQGTGTNGFLKLELHPIFYCDEMYIAIYCYIVRSECNTETELGWIYTTKQLDTLLEHHPTMNKDSLAHYTNFIERVKIKIGFLRWVIKTGFKDENLNVLHQECKYPVFMANQYQYDIEEVTIEKLNEISFYRQIPKESWRNDIERYRKTLTSIQADGERNQ